jgi:broad specificity phosphatase PhoE
VVKPVDRRCRSLVAVLLTSLATLVVAGCGGDDGKPSASATEPIVRTLRAGGLTLLMRHALTDAAINQQELLRSCASQRNLTIAGREQARAVGRAIRRLRIPIGQVRASPLCRTRDTARLAFGRATTDRMLVSAGVVGTAADDARRGRALRALVRRPPPAGENTVLVTHSPNIRAASGYETVAEGEILVLGAGGRTIGRVKAEQWPALAR